jgi:glycosyltransferase involved in cell wall biosynthesis
MAELTVVMPVYNALPYLKEACRSILEQTLTDLELLILDDSSTDGSLEYAETLTSDTRVRIERCQKQGVAALLNYGLRQVRTRYAAVMHADDVALPTRLEEQYRFLMAHPQVVMCGCQFVVIDREDRYSTQWDLPTSDLQIRYSMLYTCPFLHSAMMYRVEDVLEVGGYNPTQVPAEDYDLWSRLSIRGRLANLGCSLMRYRVHQTNLSVVRRDEMVDKAEAVGRRHLLVGRYAKTKEEAALFRIAAQSPQPVLSGEAFRAFAAVTCRFLAAFAAAPETSQDELASLRTQLRWEILRRARSCGLFSWHCYRWLGLLQRIDPAGMRIDRVARRAVAHLGRSLLSRFGPATFSDRGVLSKDLLH